VADEDPPAERLARWIERDAAIGLGAEAEQLRARLADRDRELADVREHVQRLSQRVAQLVVERDRLDQQLRAVQRPSAAQRAYRRARSLAARGLPR